MKKLYFVFFLVVSVCSIVLLIGSSSKTTGTLQAEYIHQDFVPHELLVKLKEDVVGDIINNKGLARNVFNQVQGRIKTYLNEEIDACDWEPADFKNRSFFADPYLFHIRIPEGIGLDYAISRLGANPCVAYVERNAIGRLTTDDFYYGQQWALKNTEYSGRDIHAEAAWAITTGSSDIIVAVIDSGVDYDHEDLQGNLWKNLNESENPDGVDNDLNGFEDDLHGWNFVSGNNIITDNHTHDEEFIPDDQGGHYECVPENTYHGTHTSGIIGAVANNTKGISGVCWNVKIMPIKAFDYCGQTSTPWLINALDYATSNGAFLTSNSYHIFDNSQAYREAVERALQKNRLFVAAAGNSPSGTNIDNDPWYPVCFDKANIIGVLSTAKDDKKSSFSNYGANSVDLGAPGEDIWSLKLGNDYQTHSGTSMATPFVAGVAGLALGLCPGLTYDRLKGLIIDGADYVSDLNNKCVSNGRLNAYNVLDGLGGTTPPNAPSNLIAYPISWYIVGIRWNDNSNNEVGFEIQRKYQNQAAFIHYDSKDMNATSYVYYQETINPTRSYSYRVRAANKAGISAFSTCDYSVPQTAPDAPTDLNGQSPVLEFNVNIYWVNHATNALYNYVERRIPGETDWEDIATLGYNVDSYSDNYAQAGHTYQYRVRVGNPVGSSHSNVISIEVIDW